MYKKSRESMKTKMESLKESKSTQTHIDRVMVEQAEEIVKNFEVIQRNIKAKEKDIRRRNYLTILTIIISSVYWYTKCKKS